MSETGLRHPLLAAVGVDHSFGVRGAVKPPGLLRPKQVHGADVAVADARVVRPAEADAVVSSVPGVPVGVITADCVPILACSRSGGTVVAIHAGWRGLAKGVVAAGIGELRSHGGDLPDIVAVIGPHIGVCCYEVDDPVLAALAERFGSALDHALRPARPGHAMLDLGRLVSIDLESAGLAADTQALMPNACTRCDPARFHSYRRDGPRAGRLLHHVAAKADLPAPDAA